MKMVVVIAVAITMIFASGTATAEQEIGNTRASVDAGIALLGTPYEGSQEPGRLDCLAKAIRREQPELIVIPSQQFRDFLFPYFEPSTVPKRVDDLALLLERPVVRSRVHDLGVRYLIFVTGATSTGEAHGALGCGVGYGGGGCFGFSRWEKVSSMAAIIWDLHTTKELEKAAVSATGHSSVVGIIFPIPIIALTKREACNLMAKKIVTRIEAASSDE